MVVSVRYSLLFSQRGKVNNKIVFSCTEKLVQALKYLFDSNLQTCEFFLLIACCMWSKTYFSWNNDTRILFRIFFSFLHLKIVRMFRDITSGDDSNSMLLETISDTHVLCRKLFFNSLQYLSNKLLDKVACCSFLWINFVLGWNWCCALEQISCLGACLQTKAWKLLHLSVCIKNGIAMTSCVRDFGKIVRLRCKKFSRILI